MITLLYALTAIAKFSFDLRFDTRNAVVADKQFVMMPTLWAQAARELCVIQTRSFMVYEFIWFRIAIRMSNSEGSAELRYRKIVHVAEMMSE